MNNFKEQISEIADDLSDAATSFSKKPLTPGCNVSSSEVLALNTGLDPFYIFLLQIFSRKFKAPMLILFQSLRLSYKSIDWPVIFSRFSSN